LPLAPRYWSKSYCQKPEASDKRPGTI
jgi:hypothetical protein